MFDDVCPPRTAHRDFRDVRSATPWAARTAQGLWGFDALTQERMTIEDEKRGKRQDRATEDVEIGSWIRRAPGSSVL